MRLIMRGDKSRYFTRYDSEISHCFNFLTASVVEGKRRGRGGGGGVRGLG